MAKAMCHLYLLLLVCFVHSCRVIINEVNSDDPKPMEENEYIELLAYDCYNKSLSSYTVAILEADSRQGPLISLTVNLSAVEVMLRYQFIVIGMYTLFPLIIQYLPKSKCKFSIRILYSLGIIHIEVILKISF